jgi:pimeloyl-ACP methyl ester carboxylesterase
MAVRWERRAASPPETGWFPTRPVVFDEPPPAGGEVVFDLKPRWIPPSFASVLAWTSGVLAAAAALFALWKLAARLRRKQALRRMSPRERALNELAELISRDLVARNMMKEFFLELTMIVRRYIERRHGIRAPEQTTEEFLLAVRDDPRFPPETARRLRDFLQAADLVKFAAHRPDAEAPNRAAETARLYVAADPDQTPAPPLKEK